MPFQDPATAICFCNFCGNPLRFQPLRQGEVINCVHCGMETLLNTWESEPLLPPERRVMVRKIALQANELGHRFLTGEVVNESAGDLNWIRVEFMLYDKNPLMVAVTSDSQLNFLVGQTWTFRAPVVNAEAVAASTPVFSCEHGKLPHLDDFRCDFIVNASSPEANPAAAEPRSQG